MNLLLLIFALSLPAFGQGVDLLRQTKSACQSQSVFLAGTNGAADCDPDLKWDKTANTLNFGSPSSPSCTAGKYFIWLASDNRFWKCENGVSAVWVSRAGQLNDCMTVLTSTTVFTVGPQSSSQTPCIVATYNFSSPATATITAREGNAYVYVDSSGVLTVGYGGGTFQSGDVVCSGCTAVFGITSFPVDAFRLASVTATSATWTTITDRRPFLNPPRRLVAGSGVSIAEASDSITISSTTSAYSVLTNQSNTWTTGTQSMASADALLLPVKSGACPSTENGSICYDSTNQFIRWSKNSVIRYLTYQTTVMTSGCASFGSSANIQQANGSSACVTKIAGGTVALGTSPISSNSCALFSAAATGTATTDIIDWAFASDPSGVTGYGGSGGLHIRPYPTANNVNFAVCNNTGSSITPGAMNLNWMVSR